MILLYCFNRQRQHSVGNASFCLWLGEETRLISEYFSYFPAQKGALIYCSNCSPFFIEKKGGCLLWVNMEEKSFSLMPQFLRTDSAWESSHSKQSKKHAEGATALAPYDHPKGEPSCYCVSKDIYMAKWTCGDSHHWGDPCGCGYNFDSCCHVIFQTP